MVFLLSSYAVNIKRGFELLWLVKNFVGFFTYYLVLYVIRSHNTEIVNSLYSLNSIEVVLGVNNIQIAGINGRFVNSFKSSNIVHSIFFRHVGDDNCVILFVVLKGFTVGSAFGVTRFQLSTVQKLLVEDTVECDSFKLLIALMDE